VYNNGGRVQCVVHENDENYSIDLIGNATYLYQAQVNVDLERVTFSISSKEQFTEQATYEKLQADAQEYLQKAGL
jgi:diaminopimelate epimerase